MLAGSMVDACDGEGTEEDEEYLLRISKRSELGSRRHTQAMTANQSSSPKLLTTSARQ